MDPATALKKAAGICSRQEQCSFDILQKLERWGVEQGEHEAVIARLKDEKFLDDARYAAFYVRDKFRFNQWGRMKISAMLRQKQVEEAIISSALARIDPMEYEQLCLDLLKGKDRQLKEEDPYKRKAKLLRFGAQRGFESELLYRTLDRLG